jgi:transposase-like protein
MPVCPNCSSARTVKNGRIHNGKQRFLCHECGLTFVEHPQKKVVDAVTRELIDRLLLERISLAGIARAKGVRAMATNLCERKICGVPRQVHVSAKKRGSVSSSM